MDQQELLYSHSSIAISIVLFIAIIICNETGFRVGRYYQDSNDTEVKALTGSVQASVLGLFK